MNQPTTQNYSKNKIVEHFLFTRRITKLLLKQENNRFFNPAFICHDHRRKFISEIICPIVKFKKYSTMTLVVSIGLLDGYVSQFEVTLPEMKNLGIACLSISSKLHEVDPMYFNDHAVKFLTSEESLSNLEKQILKSFKFEIDLITPLHFIFEILHYISLFPELHSETNPEIERIRSSAEDVHWIVNSSYLVNKYSSVGIALSIFVVLRECFRIECSVPDFFYHISGTCEDSLGGCVKMIERLISDFLKERNEQNLKKKTQIKSLEIQKEVSSDIDFLSKKN